MFSLDPVPDENGKRGLRIEGRRSQLQFFYNPIPAVLPESQSPTLCIIYQKKAIGSSEFETCIKCFEDHQTIEILV
jgi:hypothetical protein